MPFGFEGLAGGAYLMVGQPEKYVEWCRSYLGRGRDTHGITRAGLVNALVWTGSGDEAMMAAEGLIEAAEATRNPWVISYALLSEGFAFGDTDPVRAMEALRRGLPTTRESGNRFNESPGERVGRHGGQVRRCACCAGVHHVRDPQLLRRRQHRLLPCAACQPRSDSRPARMLRVRRRRHRQRSAQPHDRLCEPFNHQDKGPFTGKTRRPAYDALTRKGATMTPAAMVIFAYEQIDQARAELERSS